MSQGQKGTALHVVFLTDNEREAVIWAVQRALLGTDAPPPPLPTLKAWEAVVALRGALAELGGDQLDEEKS